MDRARARAPCRRYLCVHAHARAPGYWLWVFRIVVTRRRRRRRARACTRRPILSVHFDTHSGRRRRRRRRDIEYGRTREEQQRR